MAEYCARTGEWGPGRMTDDLDFERHAESLPGFRRKAAERKVLRGKAMREEYFCALINCRRPGFHGRDKVSPKTADMVRELCTTSPNGKGIMIVVRVDTYDNARQLYDSIKLARAACNMEERFAILLDANESSIDMKREIPGQLLRHVAAWRGVSSIEDLVVGSYEDLEDVPCILILVQKGKMGDTFPKSFRYYDLRMKYLEEGSLVRAPLEQDLGRACRWIDADGKDTEPPYVLVSAPARKKLASSGRRFPLLNLPPDVGSKMAKVEIKDVRRPSEAYENEHKLDRKGKLHSKSNPWYNPLNEFETISYRINWRPKKDNCDFERDGLAWSNNPRRFALVGRPQIGKTGVFLHLSYLLHQRLGITQVDSRSDTTPLEPDPADPEPEPVGPVVSENMGPYPCYKYMQNETFGDASQAVQWKDGSYLTCSCLKKPNERKDAVSWAPLEPPRKFGGCERHAPGCGKYGDPKVPELWRYYVEHGGAPGAAGAPNAGLYSTQLSRPPPHSTGAAGVSPSIAVAPDPRSASPPDLSTAHAGAEPVQMRAQMHLSTESRPWPRYRSADASRFAHTTVVPYAQGSHAHAGVEVQFFERRDGVNGHVPATTGWLHIPNFLFASHTQPWMSAPHALWQHRAVERDGRGSCPVSLNLEPTDGLLRIPIFTPSYNRYAAGEAQAKLDIRKMMKRLLYAQIIAVKGTQVEDYKREFPLHTFFELPPEADRLAVGCSRYFMKQLAHILCQDFPFCAVIDDNVDYWQAVTLTADPAPQFGLAALPKQRQLKEIDQGTHSWSRYTPPALFLSCCASLSLSLCVCVCVCVCVCLCVCVCVCVCVRGACLWLWLCATCMSTGPGTILSHFQNNPDCMAQFAIIGFGKLRGKGVLQDGSRVRVSNAKSVHAYARSHVYSAYILNLSKLEDVEWLLSARQVSFSYQSPLHAESLFSFKKRVISRLIGRSRYGLRHYVMEDIAFNRRVSARGGVICKCYRYQFAKPNQAGGCASLTLCLTLSPCL